jgi:anti-sigma factor RsiW
MPANAGEGSKNMIPMRGSNDEKLDALFRAFAACPTPEPSANFMPTLWQKIESRQTFTFSFRRMANAFAAAAVALTVALSVYMYVPHASAVPSQTYVDVLAEAHPIVAPDLLSPAQLELTDSGR